ncbi:DNA polymerase ligase N-terminal domain-containing protein [Chitinophaga caseinilytica]|uniref:DNA polymerase ligase N-terminal domain-containing protein n=1 Tax=Chitinophaga caseinilytica TaxID=2267521 RepID=A0ABZ2Z631_9BACT
MSLTKYNQKRDFKKTSEPKSGKAPGKDHIFVIQRHHATRLHYDFRLEMDGVLKSWAVPKGPSLNPADKRLAMEVEDHPFDYKDFQGEIPPGNYGAGYVYIWDKGTYELLEPNGQPFDKEALKEWKSGSLKVILHGKKLKGEFALVKMRGGREENAWLLIKHNDKYAVHDAYDSEEHTPKTVIAKMKGPHNTKPEAKAKKAASPKKASASKQASPKKAAVKKSAALKTASAKKAAPSKAAAKKSASPKKSATKETSSTGKKSRGR